MNASRRKKDFDHGHQFTGPHDDYRGPTPERFAQAQGEFVVGDDKQGTKIYHFTDTPLYRLYKRLRQANKSDQEAKQLTAEHVALMKYRMHWYHAGLESSVGSVDLNRVHSSDPSSMSGMAKSERQVSHRQMYRKAGEMLMRAMGQQAGHAAIVLLDNFVCYEHSRGIASGLSAYLFRKRVRQAAAHLAAHWGTA